MKRSRYSLLLEKLPDAFVYFRVVADCSGKAEDFVFLDLNPAFEAMIGVKKDEIIGRKITDARGCVDRLDFDWCGTYSRLTETGEALTFEHYSGPLGRWHEVTAFRDKNCYFAAIFHSISQYKQVEYEWARLSYLRAELLDNIPDCSALILKKGSREIVACNRNAREHGAVPGQKCFNVLAQRDDSCPFCQAPKLWATDKLQRIEVEYRGRWFEGIWAPLSDDFYVHYIFDITDRKLTEQKLADYTEELELLYRQLDEEMAKVGEIHKRTLPAGIPQMEKCTLATHYQPARHLGGDFYNALKVDRKVILYLSDVSGHGLGGGNSQYVSQGNH